MSPFNLFEAVGAIRGELRHSNFLAYLLSPSRPHGLGARPLAALIRSILSRMDVKDRPIMALELIAGDLDDAIVYRERDSIDILVELPSLKLVVAIENKVGSKAGDGQLKRYDERLKVSYPDHRRLMVFLTPESTLPDHDGYVAYDYSDVVTTMESLISDELEPVPTETKLIIQHYVDMVRRHIVQDEQLRTLAVTLYERHKEAFEFIFDCRPEPNSVLTVVRGCVQSVQGLVVDSSGSNMFRFTVEAWDEKLKVIKGDPAKWSKTGRGLLFEVKTYPNTPGRLNVSLILGPGDPEMRQKVYAAAGTDTKLFKGLVKPMGAQWVTIFSRDLLTANQAKGMTFEQQEFNVRAAWSDFQGGQLGSLITAIIELDELLNQGSAAPVGPTA
ncbi:PD-(D/E)XK nuclease family protein [Asticcacaulis sp.]|uniref:PDDEXK-like family protein n=1 Tax=Asticcacaulis sp. TaxID=1872648 RepID=UPI0031D944E9